MKTGHFWLTGGKMANHSKMRVNFYMTDYDIVDTFVFGDDFESTNLLGIDFKPEEVNLTQSIGQSQKYKFTEFKPTKAPIIN